MDVLLEVEWRDWDDTVNRVWPGTSALLQVLLLLLLGVVESPYESVDSFSSRLKEDLGLRARDLVNVLAGMIRGSVAQLVLKRRLRGNMASMMPHVTLMPDGRC
jgi:hypothetical protein